MPRPTAAVALLLAAGLALGTSAQATPSGDRAVDPVHASLRLTEGPDAQGRFTLEAVIAADVEVDEFDLRLDHGADVRLRGDRQLTGSLAAGEVRVVELEGRCRRPKVPLPVGVAMKVEYAFPYDALLADLEGRVRDPASLGRYLELKDRENELRDAMLQVRRFVVTTPGAGVAR